MRDPYLPTIGVLDSGIGGVSVLQALWKILPVNYQYIADQAYLPYGNQPPELIVQRVIRLCEILAKDCDAIVIACNTATALAIEVVRSRLSIPIIGIEPAIKPACLATKTGHIALCATQNMLESKRLYELIKRYAADCVIHHIACPEWVLWVEAGQHYQAIDSDEYHMMQNVIAQKLDKIKFKIDQLILGCTHFPFLTPILQDYLPSTVALINPAQAIAKRVSVYFPHISEQNSENRHCNFYSSYCKDHLRHQMHSLLRIDADNVVENQFFSFGLLGCKQ